MLLSDLQHSFDVIVFSETKIKDSSDPIFTLRVKILSVSQPFLLLVVQGFTSNKAFSFIV